MGDALGFVAQILAIIGAIAAGVYGITRALVFLGGWIQRRQQDSENFSATDKKVGVLADNATKAIRELETKFDQRMERHETIDDQRFEQLSNQFNAKLNEISRSLGYIEGVLRHNTDSDGTFESSGNR